MMNWEWWIEKCPSRSIWKMICQRHFPQMQFVFVLCQLLQHRGHPPPRHLCLISTPANISTDKLPLQWKVRGERCGEAVGRRGSELVVLCEVKCRYFDWIKVTSETLLISSPEAHDSTETIEIITFKEHSVILLLKFQLTITCRLIDQKPLVSFNSNNSSCMCHSSVLHLFPCFLSSPPQSLCACVLFNFLAQFTCWTRLKKRPKCFNLRVTSQYAILH